METEHLDKADRKQKAMMLSNIISSCMIKQNMTIENLDDACEIVKEVYRKNAMVRS